MSVVLSSEDLKALLDIATSSMNFGSGFLDNEEVEVLRRVAIQLGVDPMMVTPPNFVGAYAHDYNGVVRQMLRWSPDEPGRSERYEGSRCTFCGREEADQVHHGVSVTLPRDRSYT